MNILVSSKTTAKIYTVILYTIITKKKEMFLSSKIHEWVSFNLKVECAVSDDVFLEGVHYQLSFHHYRVDIHRRLVAIRKER